MNIDQAEVERLRSLLAEEPLGSPPGHDCPSPDELWEAVQGNLPQTRLGELIDHTIECPRCAEEWRLAAELAREPTSTNEAKPAPRSWSYHWRTPLAAAAALLLVVLGWATSSLLWKPAPDYRGGGRELTSPVDGQSLPRDRFLLRWAGAPPGSRYELLVTREDLTVITQADDLTEDQFQVPGAVLQDLPAGSRILWRVETILPDGTRLKPERTFVSILR